MRRPPLPLSLLSAAALLLAPGSAVSVDFDDRDGLATLLTLDEQAPLADAEEALAEAESDLADATTDLDAAQMEFDAASMTLTDAETALGDAETALTDAQMALDQGIMDGLPPDQIALLEQDVMDAEGAVDSAEMAVSDAQDAVDAAQMALSDAQDVVDTAQMAVDEAEAVVQAILDEIEDTETFVENLDDRQVFALNRSLHPAVQTGLLPLDIPLDLLQRIIDEDLGDGEIQALTRGFRFELFFDRKADEFEAQGKTMQAERFAAKADEMLARNLARVDGPPGLAKKAANDAANQAANDAANDAINLIVQAQMQSKAADQAAKDAINQIVQAEMQSKAGNGKGKGLAHAPGQN